MSSIFRFQILIYLALFCSIPVLVFAQQDALTGPGNADLDAQITEIEQQAATNEQIASRLANVEQNLAAAMQSRLQRERIDLIVLRLDFANQIASTSQDDVRQQYQPTAIEQLQLNIQQANDSWTSIADAMTYPDAGLGVAEQSSANQDFFQQLQNEDRFVELLGESIELLEELETDIEAIQADFHSRLEDRAFDLSVYLELAQAQAADRRAAYSALPDDAEISGQLVLADERITAIAASMQRVVTSLEALDIDVSLYREQIVVATGQISSDIFNLTIITDLLRSWRDQVMNYIRTEGPDLIVRVVIVLIILFAAFRISVLVKRLVDSGLNRSKVRLSQLLRRMIVSTVGNLVLAVGVLFALSQMGISLGPLLAGLGIAGFIIGFALQDTLSNFASGMMILFYRPYDVGDVVEINSMLGKVEKMSLVNTTIHTFDNQRIIMPNSMIWGGIIKNVTSQKTRRVDMKFGISYTDDIDKAEGILNRIMEEHELILDDPEPTIKVHELADSSVNFVVRPWTETENYWTVYWDVTKAVKQHFDAEEVSIPFPQRDVHVYSHTDPAQDNGDTQKETNQSEPSGKGHYPGEQEPQDEDGDEGDDR